MSTRPIMIALLAGAAIAAGCGPSKAGQEARAQARQRLNYVNAQLAHDQAKQALEVGQFDKALSEVHKAIAQHPEWAPYRLLEGRVYLEQHRLERANESFEMAVELKPDYAEAHYYLGIVNQRWSKDAEAYDQYLSAFELEDDNVAYLMAAAESQVAMEHLAEARQLIEPKLAFFEHNAALRQLLGRIAMLDGDINSAVQQFDEAWRLNPEDKGLLEELAHAQYAAELYGQCYRSVMQLQDMVGTKRPDLRHLEARCLTYLDRTEDARNIYLELTRAEPTNVELWVELGTIAWELGDYHRTALCGARVTALAPDRFEGYLLKGVNERHHGNLTEAKLYLEQSAQRCQDMALPYLVLGRVLEQLGDGAGALAAYEQAIRIEPDNPDAQALYFDGQERLLTQHPEEVFE